METISHEGVSCEACGEKFSLVGENTRTYHDHAGRMVGQFRLLDVVGFGGFGIVWRALDTELDRVVAVKMPRSGMISDAEANQFMREAQAVAQLKHPRIVSVHEVGRFDGLLYIVSDYVDGAPLSEWLRAHRPSCREAARLTRSIAEALDHAHTSGVIHRDMKSRNILLDADGDPKIVDFGLARRDAGDMTVTCDGTIVGTPAYMSPEQATGDSLAIDGRSDIYSTGAILYELMTGERPFRGNHRMLLHQVVNDEPPSPHRLNGSIPRDLETICLKCLEKSPARRYQTAGELAADLGRYLDGEPIKARPVGMVERGWKWARRRPLVASLLSAVVLTVLLGLAGVTWQWRRAVASQQRHAQTQVELILNAEPEGAESAILGLSELRELVEPQLQAVVDDAARPISDRMRARLALIDREPQHAESVVHQLLQPAVRNVREVALGSDLLARSGAIPTAHLIEIAADSGRPETLRFRALFILARTHDSRRDRIPVPWQELAPFVTGHLVADAAGSPDSYPILVDTFRPVRGQLLPTLGEFLCSEAPSRSERFTAATIVAEYAADRPESLCDLMLEVEPEEYAVILPSLQPHREFAGDHFAKLLAGRSDDQSDPQKKEELLGRQAAAAVTLLHLDQRAEAVWPLLRESPDQTLRTLLIHRLGELALPPERLVSRLRAESEVSIRRALLLALGEYDPEENDVREKLLPHLENLYRRDPDAGIHSAIAWLLRTWDEGERLAAMDAEPSMAGPLDDRDWYVNSQGQAMIIIDYPPIFRMGPGEDEPLQTQADRRHLRHVNRRFAMAATEVTWEQFKRFKVDAGSRHSQPDNYGPDRDGPALSVSWVQAARYCRWLSEQEGIEDDQMCFPELDVIRREGNNMELPENLMQRTGYRLPSEGEWECACRVGTTTIRHFGTQEERVDEYGWSIGNSANYAWRCGLLKPNDYGLFDMYGNAWEWCLDRHGSLPTRPPGVAYLDAPKLVGTKGRIVRGGSMENRTEALRSAQRDMLDALHERNHNVGFRIVRTLPPVASIDSE